MPNISDPIWGVIGVIATIVFGIFGVVGVIFAFLQLIQSKKQLSYEFVSNTPILKIAKEYQDQIEIRFNQQIVKNVHLVTIRLSNSGKASIKPDDYVRPLKISVKKGQIISAEIIETDPQNLGELIEKNDSTSVTFNKVLLNSKDEFIIKFLIGEFSGETEDIEIDARIDGLKSIVEWRESAIAETLFRANSSNPLFVVLTIPFLPYVAIFRLLVSILKEINTTFDNNSKT